MSWGTGTVGAGSAPTRPHPQTEGEWPPGSRCGSPACVTRNRLLDYKPVESLAPVGTALVLLRRRFIAIISTAKANLAALVERLFPQAVDLRLFWRLGSGAACLIAGRARSHSHDRALLRRDFANSRRLSASSEAKSFVRLRLSVEPTTPPASRYRRAAGGGSGSDGWQIA